MCWSVSLNERVQWAVWAVTTLTRCMHAFGASMGVHAWERQLTVCVCVCGLFCTVSGLRGQTASEYGPFLRRLGRQRSSQNGQHSLHRCGLQWEGKRADHAHLGSYRTFQWLCCVGHTDSLSLPVRVLRRVHCLDWYTLR